MNDRGVREGSFELALCLWRGTASGIEEKRDLFSGEIGPVQDGVDGTGKLPVPDRRADDDLIKGGNIRIVIFQSGFCSDSGGKATLQDFQDKGLRKRFSGDDFTDGKAFFLKEGSDGVSVSRIAEIDENAAHTEFSRFSFIISERGGRFNRQEIQY